MAQPLVGGSQRGTDDREPVESIPRNARQTETPTAVAGVDRAHHERLAARDVTTAQPDEDDAGRQEGERHHEHKLDGGDRLHGISAVT